MIAAAPCAPDSALESLREVWNLFGDAWVCGSLIAMVLALAGVVVVARDQIFVGLALAQASTLGIAFGLCLASWLPPGAAAWSERGAAQDLFAVTFAIGAAALTARPMRSTGASHEAVIGWVFLFANSGWLLLASHSPHSRESIQHLIASTLLGATRSDVVLFAVLLASVSGAWIWKREPILLHSIDPSMAAALGVGRGFGLMVWGAIGLCVGLSIRVAGVLFTSGYLVLPALAASQLCRSSKRVLLLAPVIALLSVAAGFALSHRFDDPPAPAAVAVVAVVALLCALVRRRR